MAVEQLLYKIRRGENPFYSGMKTILMKVMYMEIPGVKYIFVPLYEFVILWRFCFHWLVEKLVYVPVFKARCFRCGKGLSLPNGIPWIEGYSKIIIGNDVQLDDTVISSGHRTSEPTLIIGDRTVICYKTTISIGHQVTIGDDCLIASGCTISDNDGHPISPYRRMRKEAVRPDEIKPVVIEDNVWIGSGSTILKGVRIGKGSIIAARSLVSKDIPQYSIAMGVPAVVVESCLDITYREEPDYNSDRDGMMAYEK